MKKIVLVLVAALVLVSVTVYLGFSPFILIYAMVCVVPGQVAWC